MRALALEERYGRTHGQAYQSAGRCAEWGLLGQHQSRRGGCRKLDAGVVAACHVLSRLRGTVSQGITILLTLLLCLDDFDSILTAIEVPPGFGALLQYHIERLNILHTLLL